MIKNLWAFISAYALKPEYNQRQIRRYSLINQYLIVAILIYLLNALSDLIYGYYLEAFILVCTIVFFCILFILKKHHHPTSLVISFIHIGITIFYFGTPASIQAGDYLYYFPLVLAISFIFDPKKEKVIMLFLFCFITFLLVLYAYRYKTSAEINMVGETIRYQMFIINLVISSASVGSFIYLTVRENAISYHIYEQRIKEKEESEVLIKKTLAEKEVLLAELHHRVKNNLAVIVGYFNLKLRSTENVEARQVLLESKNHVNSMALIHNRLYKTGNLSEVNFTTYLNDLLVEIKESYPLLANSVEVDSRIENIKLNLSSAVPCALIINEVLTNCYKHAFKAANKGVIQIKLLVGENDQLTLSIKDNGVGLKEDFDKSDSLGISVISGLSEQLNGKYNFFNDGGACFTLEFYRE
jgi:two-component sensor histidine kinase